MSDLRPFLSASQVTTFRRCARRWAFEYLEDRKVRATDDGAALGTAVHEELERYGLSGTLPDASREFVLAGKNGPALRFPGQIAQAALHLCPVPGSVEVEDAFAIVTPRARYRGRMDALTLLTPGGGCAHPSQWAHPAKPADTIPAVIDYKTSASARYAKSADDLATDVQANLYAWATLERFRVDVVRARWIYTLTTAFRAWLVEREMRRAEVAQEIAAIDTTAETIYAHYRARPKALEVLPNYDACDDFGGCPHREICPAGTAEKMQGYMGNIVEEMIARKQAELARMNGGAAPSAPAMAVPAPPPSAQEMAQGYRGPPVYGYRVEDAVPPPAPPAIAPDKPLGFDPLAGRRAPAIAMPAPPAIALPPVPAPSRSYWLPGDPTNAAQDYLAAHGRPLSVIASAADVPPPAHIGLAYDAGGVVERTVINPPEAPPYAPASPEQMPPVAPPPPVIAAVDEFSSLDRAALKSMAVAQGLVAENTRTREDGLRDLLREAKRTGRAAPSIAPSAPTVTTYSSASAPLAPPELHGTPIAPPAPPPVVRDRADAYGTPPPAPSPIAAPALDPVGPMVFVSCLPSPVPAFVRLVTLTSLLTPVLASIHEGAKVPHYRLIEYGQGPARLAAGLAQRLGELRLGADTWVVVDGETSEGKDSIACLERVASVIVRGVR